MEKLKAQSHDPELAAKLSFAETAEGRASVAEMIRAENATRYEETTAGTIVAVSREGKRSAVAKSGVSGSRASGRAPAKARAPERIRAVADGRAGVKLPRKRTKIAAKSR